MTEPNATSSRPRLAHHGIGLVKGAAHHVGALLLMTVMRGILLTALGAGGVAALSTFLPDELHAPEASVSHTVATPGQASQVH